MSNVARAVRSPKSARIASSGGGGSRAASSAITSPLQPQFGHINARRDTIFPQSGQGIRDSPCANNGTNSATNAQAIIFWSTLFMC